MHLKPKILILFLLILNHAKSQDSLICSFDTDATFFTSDQYLNIYFINSQNEIVKYNCINGDSITYSNKQIGRPGYIDATNPLKILVLYPDFSSIVILDNKLSEISVIRFNSPQNGIAYKPTAACREAESDRIWLYDELSRKIIQFDETGNKLAESEAFDDIFQTLPTISQLISSDQKIYAIDTVNGLFVFDYFATYLNNLEIKTEGFSQILMGSLISISGDTCVITHLQSGESDETFQFSKSTTQFNLQLNIAISLINGRISMTPF